MYRLSLLLLVAFTASPAVAQTPQPAPQRVFDVRHMSCGQFTALPDTDKPPVVWYMAGYYKSAGNFGDHFDLDVAARGTAAVAKACADKPAASLRYTVAHVFAKGLQAVKDMK